MKLVQMAWFVVKTQRVLIYNVNKAVDRIHSCRAWFPVYLNMFYERQYLGNVSLKKIKVLSVCYLNLTSLPAISMHI